MNRASILRGVLGSLLAAAAMGAGILTAPAARAGEGSFAALNSAPLAEITVTAQKRPELLEQVPLTVDVVTGTRLNGLQIYESNGLPAAVSSLTYQQGNNPTNTNFRIRGIGTALFDQGVEGDVSV